MVTVDKNDFRLNAFIGRSGYCSRRKADALIREGKVAVNGSVVQDFSLRVAREDTVSVNGVRIEVQQNYSTFLLNKPPGYLCSHRSSPDKPVIYSLLPAVSGLTSCGRLDFYTSGLIILSNDGNFVHQVTHPRARIEKQYTVTARHTVSEQILKRMRGSSTIDNVCYTVHSVARISCASFSLVLLEGKNREIRNLCRENKISLRSIHRVRIGSISEGTLSIGAHRVLTTIEQRDLTHAYMY